MLMDRMDNFVREIKQGLSSYYLKSDSIFDGSQQKGTVGYRVVQNGIKDPLIGKSTGIKGQTCCSFFEAGWKNECKKDDVVVLITKYERLYYYTMATIRVVVSELVY